MTSKPKINKPTINNNNINTDINALVIDYTLIAQIKSKQVIISLFIEHILMEDVRWKKEDTI